MMVLQEIGLEAYTVTLPAAAAAEGDKDCFPRSCQDVSTTFWRLSLRGKKRRKIFGLVSTLYRAEQGQVLRRKKIGLWEREEGGGGGGGGG